MEKKENNKDVDLTLDDEPDVNDKVDELLDYKKLDESNPQERAKKFEMIKQNPPEPDYMKVELCKKIEDGKEIVFSKSKGVNGDGEEKIIEHDVFFTIDLKTLIDADVGAVPSNTIPMLIDQAVQTAGEERKAFKPEKRKDQFNWWWLVFVLLMLPGIIFLLYYIFG